MIVGSFFKKKADISAIPSFLRLKLGFSVFFQVFFYSIPSRRQWGLKFYVFYFGIFAQSAWGANFVGALV